MGLALDFKVGDVWKTVHPDQARKVTLASAGRDTAAAAQNISVDDLTELVAGGSDNAM